jgi:predicted AlkP superfamily phosphohydrolase/phosphomutase
VSGPPAKILVLGIDAANPGLLRRWGADGTLPNLGGLMARGLVGETRSVEGFVVGATWPTLYTGVTPARHGFHYTVQLKPGTYQYHHSKVEHESFWTGLSRAGKRLAIIDVPLTELDRDINGMHMVDWSGIEALSSFRAWPAGVREEVEAKWGRYPLEHSCDGLRQSLRDYSAFIDDLLRGVAMRAELTTHFLAKGGWDLFMQVFTESHCAGHQVWHLHDTQHPAHDAAMAASLGDPLRRVYAAIDRAIGQVLEAAGDTRVLVITAHGMSHWFGAQFILEEILIRLGASEAAPAMPPRPAPRGAALGMARRVWHLAPPALRAALRPPRARLEPRIQGPPPLPSIGVDPSRSKCFVVRNGHLTAGIRLNLMGREPHGVLQSGSEAEGFCKALTRDLLEIVDERTGRPVIRRVARTANLFEGDRIANLPDLLLDWDDAVPTGSSHHGGGAGAVVRVHSPRIGMVEGTNQFTRTGDHRIGGIFVAAGGGIRSGTMNRTVSTLDFAPTLAALLGADLPGTDGTVISEITQSLRR